MEEMDMPQRLDNHEQRISQLETNYGEVINKISSMEKGQLEIQNVVLKSSGDQKDLLNKLIEHSLGITVKQEETKGEVSKLKISSRKEIVLGLLGGGGFVGILTAVIAFWGEITNTFGG
ncbi:hypothetical protein ABE28_003265 [Peribacillus muralis]|uniref:Uncharacterized protein n=1 Tax=Peribacillus muralis TaxID=264697 RepID=A0A1B3XJI6_9BACI|nr:hypothetical protein [Peribacillus muralis]AOH53359.1 hypothetical protein ABE28_003265 [Peribacillus muralis]